MDQDSRTHKVSDPVRHNRRADPFGDPGEEFVHSSEVFFFQVWEVFQNLIFRHSVCEIRCKIVDREAQAANAGLAPLFPDSTVIRGPKPTIVLPQP